VYGFGCDRVNFLCSSLYGAMFGICAGNSVDNTGIFSLLLSSAYTASKTFLLHTPPYQQVGWRCIKSWEGTQPDPSRPKGYSIRYDIMFSSKPRRESGREAAARGLAGYWLVMSSCFHLHHFSLLCFIFHSLFFFFFFPYNLLSLLFIFNY